MLRPTALFLALLGASACGGRGAGGQDGGPDPDPDAGVAPHCVDPESPFSWPVEERALRVTASESWADSLGEDSPFFTGNQVDGAPKIRWAKLSVLLEAPETVYFQDSQAYPFHYDFISEHLDPYEGIERDELDAITLHADGQKIALGAVLFPTRPGIAEYGIQLVGLDPYHPELVRDLFERIAGSVDAPGREPVYVPTVEQAPCAEAHRDWFADHGIRVASSDAWLPGDQCYADGWAVGRLVPLAAGEVEEAALSGALAPDDLLLLEDRVPAELPPVAGVLSLAPSTPNSHTAILAQSFGIPFAYLRQPESAARAEALADEMVAVGTAPGYPGGCHVQMIDLGAVDAGILEELRALAAPPPLEVPAKSHRGAAAVDVDDVGPGDIDTVGGKAAHYGALRDAIPDHVRPAVALSFDVWDAFLDQELASGLTLREEIDQRLSGYAWPPPMAELDAELDAIRDLIRNQTELSPALREEIEAALSGFDPAERLRFRSSTNVEDGETFTGAGLYDSVSGCLADDLDGDDSGPSACEEDEPEERGIYRALRKVYAGFYRRNAFLERLRRGVDEDEVGMAVLVHHSFPDETEQANGVAVLDRNYSDSIELVSQLGAVSVTNPEGGARPEVVKVEVYELGAYPGLIEGSSLVPLGGTVLAWEEDYLALAGLIGSVADRLETDPEAPLSLDFEYKKIDPGELVVKQVRPLPRPDATRDVTPLLVDAPTRLCVFHGEYGDVFANHRLKSTWALRSRTAWLTDQELSSTLLRQLELEMVDGGVLGELSGEPASLPGFTHELEESSVVDRWRFGAEEPRALSLEMHRPPLRARSQLPALELGAAFFYLQADYDDPVLYIDWQGEPGTRSSETVRLVPRCADTHEPGDRGIFVERTVSGGGVSIESSFYWPPPPEGPSAGYTAPLIGWEETRITGLTTEPIVLESPWSQTYRPMHHNFGAHYLFEPGLEPGISPSILEDLAAANVRMIYAEENGRLLLIGFDGQVREP